MSGKAKSIYLTVCVKGDPFDIKLRKQFFNAKDYNAFIRTPEFKEKYPEERFRLVKEVY